MRPSLPTELTERVMDDILELENPHGVIVSTGGQMPNNALPCLDAAQGTYSRHKRREHRQCEGRQDSRAMLDRIGVDQPEWRALTSWNINAFVDMVGFVWSSLLRIVPALR